MRGGGLVPKFYWTGEAKKLGQSDSDNYLFSLNTASGWTADILYVQSMENIYFSLFSCVCGRQR
jgi:hypothetical protein